MDFARKVRKPVAIIAPDFKSEALTSLVVNHLKNVVKVVAIKTPVGQQSLPLLEDIASFSDGIVVSQAMGLRLGSIDPIRYLGKVESTVITKDRTILVGGHGKMKARHDREYSPIDERVFYLQGILDSEDLLLGEEEQEEMMARI